jgi:hypothetical protein
LADGRKNNGGHKTAGRKPKVEEQKLIEHLTPLHPKAMSAFTMALNTNEKWAVELFFKYFYGMPKQQIDHTSDGDKMSTPIITLNNKN